LADHIISHVAWIRGNPDEALEKARAAQESFIRSHALDKPLPEIYRHQAGVRKSLRARPNPPVDMVVPVLWFDQSQVSACIESIARQTHANIRLTVVVSESLSPEDTRTLDAFLEDLGRPFKLLRVRAWDGAGGFRGLGQMLEAAIENVIGTEDGFICIIAPDEVLSPDHIERCLDLLSRSPEVGIRPNKDMAWKRETASGCISRCFGTRSGLWLPLRIRAICRSKHSRIQISGELDPISSWTSTSSRSAFREVGTYGCTVGHQGN